MVLHFWFGIKIKFLVEKVKKNCFKLDHTIAKLVGLSFFVVASIRLKSLFDVRVRGFIVKNSCLPLMMIVAGFSDVTFRNIQW